MITSRNPRRQRGAVMAETVMVLPIYFLAFLLMFYLGRMGVRARAAPKF